MTSTAHAAPSIRSSISRHALRIGMPAALAVLLALYGAVVVDGFLSFDNLVNVIRSQSLIGIAAVGMTLVVISGNFVDLSVPATVAVAANAVLAFQTIGIVPAVFLTLAIGVVIGLVNGSIVAYLGVNPVIATLGVGSVVAGILLWQTGAALSRGTDRGFNQFMTSRPLDIPLAAWVFLTLLVLGHVAFTRTRFGAQLRITGGNPRAALIAGVPTRRITVTSFALMGLAAAIAGVLLGGFADQADIAVGAGFEFDALIAVVLGGTLLTGGIGGFAQTFLGVLLLGLVNNLLLLNGVGTSMQLLSRGALFLLVVGGDAVLQTRLRRRG